jgi:hypothetical protein
MDEQRQMAGRHDPRAAETETKGPAPWTPSYEGLARPPAVALESAGVETSEPPETAEPDQVETSEAEGSSGGFVGHIQNVAAPVAGAIGSVIEAASQALSTREAATGRRLSRQAHEPLANLYELHPEAKSASPRELGVRFVPIEEVRGTAVAGPAQRGGDFLPLKPFRGDNWRARWQRIREANYRLQPLPPVDLIKYNGEYWVVDGHNRVAVTLYGNGVGLDAMVTELIPLDGGTSERPSHVLSLLGETGELRGAAQRRRPAIGMRRAGRLPPDEAGRISTNGPSPEDEAEMARPGAEAESRTDARSTTSATPGADTGSGANTGSGATMRPEMYAWPRADSESMAPPTGQPEPGSGRPTLPEGVD